MNVREVQNIARKAPTAERHMRSVMIMALTVATTTAIMNAANPVRAVTDISPTCQNNYVLEIHCKWNMHANPK